MSFSNKIVTTYAKSLFQNVNELKSSKDFENNFTLTQLTISQTKQFLPDISVVGEELTLIRSILMSSKKLKSFFINPTYAEQQKLEIILSIFPGLTLITKSFLKVLTERSHLSLIPEISEEYSRILSKFQNATLVKVVTASPLNPSYGPLLLDTLKKLTKSTDIVLNLSYNPKLLGGLILEYNSVAIDASILKEFSLFFNET